MLAYLRRVLWGLRFTERAPRQLSQHEWQRLKQAAWEAVHHHPHFWLMGRLLPLQEGLAAFLLGLGWVLGMIPLILIELTLPVLFVTHVIWLHRRFRESLRQKLLDASIRPAFCFECGHELEGYEGNECPACDAPLLRQGASLPDRSQDTSKSSCMEPTLTSIGVGRSVTIRAGN